VEFNPQTETFVGNDDANAMLSKEYRAPYRMPT